MYRNSVLAANLNLGCIFVNKTQKQRRQIVFDDMVNQNQIFSFKIKRQAKKKKNIYIYISFQLMSGVGVIRAFSD